MKATNYVIIQGWMLTELQLKGHPLMLYAILYSFGQSEPGTGFRGTDNDLQSFCSNIIPHTSYYEARRKLQAAGLLRYENGLFSVVSTESVLNLYGNRTKTSTESVLHIINNNINNNKGNNNNPQKSEFYDVAELIRRRNEQQEGD